MNPFMKVVFNATIHNQRVLGDNLLSLSQIGGMKQQHTASAIFPVARGRLMSRCIQRSDIRFMSRYELVKDGLIHNAALDFDIPRHEQVL